MMSAQQLLSAVSGAANRYGKFKLLFDQFHVDAEEFLGKLQEHPIQGLTFRSQPERNTVTVEAFGKEVRLKLRMISTTKAEVDCVVVEVGSENETALGSFTFNSQGATSLKDDRGDDLEMADQRSAAYIVIHYLHEALTMEA